MQIKNNEHIKQQQTTPTQQAHRANNRLQNKYSENTKQQQQATATTQQHSSNKPLQTKNNENKQQQQATATKQTT